MVQCLELRVYSLGFIVWGLRRVVLAARAREVGEEDVHRNLGWGFEFQVQDLGLTVYGLWFRVYGSGFGV